MTRIMILIIFTLALFGCSASEATSEVNGTITLYNNDFEREQFDTIQISYQDKYVHGITYYNDYIQGEYIFGFKKEEYSDKAFKAAQKNIREYEKNHRLKGRVVYSFYPDGSIMELTTYSNNKANGLTRNFYKSNQVWFEAFYKDGLKDGLEVLYNEDSSIASKTFYKDGKKSGATSYYDGDGSEHQEVIGSSLLEDSE